MRNFKITLFSITIVGIFWSCASSYRSIDPKNLNYAASDASQPLAYKYDVLKQAGNNKYAKKEDKGQIRVMAIRITNNTTETLKYGSNYKIYAGSQEVAILPFSTVAQSLNQPVPIYLLYLLLTPARFYVNTETSESSFPIGYALGPGLTALNMAIAGKANSNFKKEMETYSIIDKEIKVGETLYGLVAIRNTEYLPLSIRMTGN